MAKHFNKYIATIVKNLDKRISKLKNKFSDYLNDQNLTSFFLNPATEKEISNINITLNARKATGSNSVSNFILKEFKEELKKPLTIIFSMSFITGQFSTKGREAHIYFQPTAKLPN